MSEKNPVVDELRWWQIVLQIDIRNPVVHMTLWTLMATMGLAVFMLLLQGVTPQGRAALFGVEVNTTVGVLFWLTLAFLSGLLTGIITGSLVWLMTFSALVSEKNIGRYYFQVWLWLGLLLGVVAAGIVWWYVTGEAWQNFPLTTEPRVRDAMLAVVWLVVVPLVGATRFIDSIKADDTRRNRRRRRKKDDGG
ncbi:MAG: hypothetical protein AAFN11_03190 [Chloroflexota bacterium]